MHCLRRIAGKKCIYLSEAFIKKYENVDFVNFPFGDFVRDVYKVRKWESPEPQGKHTAAPQQPHSSRIKVSLLNYKFSAILNVYTLQGSVHAHPLKIIYIIAVGPRLQSGSMNTTWSAIC